MSQKSAEVELKEIAVLFIQLIAMFRKSIFKIILLVLLSIAFSLFIYVTLPAKYEAVSKLYLQSKSLSGNPLLTGLIGDMSGIGSFSEIGEETFINIAQSKQVLKNTLVKKIKYRGREELLLNHVIDCFSWREDWADIQRLKGFHFVNEDPEQFTYMEDSLFNSIFDEFSSDMSVSSDDECIVNVSLMMMSDSLAMEINKLWVLEMIAFFKEKSNSGILRDLSFQKSSIDSLKEVISETEELLTRFRDEKNAIVKAQAYVDKIRLERELEINTLLLGEMLKNHEKSKYTMMTQKPIVEIIDSPRLPLEEQSISLLNIVFIGGFIGSIISLILFVFIPYVKENVWMNAVKEAHNGFETT
jgi:hypothetical protein